MKASHIVLPEQPEWSQGNLFAPTSLAEVKPFDPFPEVLRTQTGFEKVLERATDCLGIDFEFNPKTNKPSILGISVRDLAAAIPWDARLATKVVQWCMKFGIKLVGHSVVGADRPVLEQALGIYTPLNMWEDTMREHYLLHSDFNKATGTKEDDGEGSLGFNNLWIMASLTTKAYNWKVCVTGDTYINTDQGYIKLERIVNEKLNVKVLSNVEGCLEYVEIKDYIKNLRGKKNIYKVYYQGFVNGKRGGAAKVTEDHELLTNRGWVRADEITHTDLLATGTPGLFGYQYQLLAGSCIGDGHIDDNGRLHLFHAEPQIEYLRLKQSCLSNLSFGKDVIKKASGNCEIFTHIKSKCWPVLKYFNYKKHFGWLSLAILYMDDGYLSVDKRAEISTISWEESQVDWLINKISELGIHAEKRKSPSMKGFNIQFDVVETKKLCNLISSAVPNCLRYKLYGNNLRNFNLDIYQTHNTTYFAPAIVEKTKRRDKYVYCLNVGKSENFVTASSIVHNCRGRACEGPCPKHQVFDYCAIDSWTGLEGHYVMQAEMKRVGVPYSFYRELMELAEICHLMETQGVRIDVPYIEVLDKQMEEAKDAIFEYTENNGKKFYKTFNPKSPDQISTWFASRGENLQSTDIKYIQRKLEKLSDAGEFPELTDYVEFLEQNLEKQNETTQELYKLYKFKTSGKGTDAWFNAKYRKRDFIHARFIDTGTSSGRLSSSKPNFTNIPSRGFASAIDENGTPFNRIKKAIIPRDESLDFLEADAAQLELRGCLYLSGVDPTDAGDDAFTWLVQQNPEGFRKAAELWPGLDPNNPKDVRYTAKSMSHAADYLEGIDIFTDEDLAKPQTKKLIAAGAIRLYPKWEYCGGIVGFTGSNLAQRFFGSRSVENRIKALQIQEDVYFKTFGMIRKWQQKVLAQIESNGCINTSTGRYLRLYGTPRDNAKAGVATLGQGLGADHIEAIMIQYYRQEKFLFDIMVHDSLLAGIPREWSDKRARDFIQPMAEESGMRLPGFKAPIDVKRGPNYGCMRKLKI